MTDTTPWSHAQHALSASPHSCSNKRERERRVGREGIERKDGNQREGCRKYKER
jgi:hypothetical protein